MCEMLTGWHPFYTPNVDDAQSVQVRHFSTSACKPPLRQHFCSPSQCVACLAGKDCFTQTGNSASFRARDLF